MAEFQGSCSKKYWFSSLFRKPDFQNRCKSVRIRILLLPQLLPEKPRLCAGASCLQELSDERLIQPRIQGLHYADKLIHYCLRIS